MSTNTALTLIGVMAGLAFLALFILLWVSRDD